MLLIVEGIKIPYQQSETSSFMTTIKVELINKYFLFVVSKHLMSFDCKMGYEKLKFQ